MFNTTEHPEEVKKFLTYLAGYEAQAQAAQQQSELPQAADILYQFTPSSATNPCRYGMEDL
mgnify:CR=1 FL=1